MDREEIKNILIDFICDYDPNKWSNDDVYEKYAEKIDKVRSMGEIIAFTELTKKVKDLETKLAESEKESNARYSAWQEEIGECDRLREQLAETDKLMQEYLTKCLSLEKQLKEKDQAIESLQEINQSLGQTCNNDAKEIERLREKENLLNLIVDGYYTPTNIVKRQIREQNQTAIEELEKVKEIILEISIKNYVTDEPFVKLYREDFDGIFDQQINELKGDK